MIHYSRQYIDQQDIKNVINTLKSDYLTTGPKVPLFEKKISNYVGSKYSVALNSATSALHIACLALGLKKGDIVWTSPNSFVASANCALYCGAKVDFVDIDENDFNISIDLLKKKLKLAKVKKKLPKILIPVHFGGKSCDMKEIHMLSKRYKFKVIEDASHALGAKYFKERVGNCKFSDIAIFSLHPVKIITTFEGGIATTNNKEIYEKIKILRNHGITKDFKKNSKQKIRAFFRQEMLGFNYRMNDVQASMGISQLKKVNLFLKKREKIKRYYDNQLKNTKILTQSSSNFSKSSNHLYVIRLRTSKNENTRDKLLNLLKNKKIFCSIHYIPIHLHPYYKKLGFKKGDFKYSEKYYNEALSIPIHPMLTMAQAKLIIKNIKNFIN
jgi:UDP-4-amino-4,6-dideoxy-N-acetyl-beta-L-altrosamine transaminase